MKNQTSAVNRRVIVLTREVSISDIPLLRYMKKMGENRVIKLQTDPERFEFLVQLVNDLGNANGLADYTTTGVKNLTPSTYYHKLCSGDLEIPTFYMATLTDGKLSNIEHVTTRGLVSLVRGRDWSDPRD